MLNVNTCLIHVTISFDVFVTALILSAMFAVCSNSCEVGTVKLGSHAMEKVRAPGRLAVSGFQVLCGMGGSRLPVGRRVQTLLGLSLRAGYGSCSYALPRRLFWQCQQFSSHTSSVNSPLSLSSLQFFGL